VRFATAFALVTLVASGACNSRSGTSNTASSTPTSSDKDALALMQTSRDFARAAATGKVEEILSYWSDDAIVLAPDVPAYIGKQAIRGMVESSFRIPKFSITWEPEFASISKAGELGYLIEHNRVTVPDSAGKVRTVYGKAVTIWRKDPSGHWKCVVDTWNTNPTELALPSGLTPPV